MSHTLKSCLTYFSAGKCAVHCFYFADYSEFLEFIQLSSSQETNEGIIRFNIFMKFPIYIARRKKPTFCCILFLLDFDFFLLELFWPLPLEYSCQLNAMCSVRA